MRASAGSLFHVDVVRAPDAAAADRARCAAAGCRSSPPTAHGERDLDDLADAGGLAAPTAWLFGSEAHGLPADARRPPPTPGCGCRSTAGAESLNLAAAAAVCLYASAEPMR